MNSVKIKFENDILRNPFHLKTWLQYINSISNINSTTRFIIFERALKYLPRSYKLWVLYLSEVSNRLKGKKITDKRYHGLKSLYERSLVHMNKMPLIW